MVPRAALATPAAKTISNKIYIKIEELFEKVNVL